MHTLKKSLALALLLAGSALTLPACGPTPGPGEPEEKRAPNVDAQGEPVDAEKKADQPAPKD